LKGERVLFVLALPDGGVAHVATWTLTLGRRRVVEFCATLIPAEGPVHVGAMHYPGWMLKSYSISDTPDDTEAMSSSSGGDASDEARHRVLSVMGFGSSEIVADRERNIVTLRVSAPGLGFRSQFIANANAIEADVDVSGGKGQGLPYHCFLGTVTGLWGAAGLQGEIAGFGAWETSMVDLRTAPSPNTDGVHAPGPEPNERAIGFSRAWVMLDDVSLAFPVGPTSRGGPFSFGGPARKDIFNPDHTTQVSGSLAKGLHVTIANRELSRSWTVLAEEVLDTPLIGYLPFSWSLERRWLSRRLPQWRLRMYALSLPNGRRVGVYEEWSVT
jgi:hypothetical protein